MRQFQAVTRKTYEGVDASVPSIRECETWAKTEDAAIDSLIERLKYFLSVPDDVKVILDKSRREGVETFYTIMIEDS
jgi:hypothetical protein